MPPGGSWGSSCPPLRNGLGLVETLRDDLQQLREETKCQITFEASDVSIPQELKLPLYRILREAITNVRKHSLSPTLRVRLRAQPSEVVAEVRDEGKGFDTSSDFRGRMGLFSMWARAQALGGECQIQSAVGQGTTVRVRLPIKVSPVGNRGNL